MAKILIDPGFGFMSIGVHAMVISTMKIINKFVSDAEFAILSTVPDSDSKIYCGQGFNTRIIPCDISSKFKAINTFIREYKNNDIIVGVSGDGYVNPANMILVQFCVKVSIADMLNKKMVLFPHSIGPINNKFIRPFLRSAFKKVSFIAVREDISKKYLMDIGLDADSIYLCPDVAFVLDPTSQENINKILLAESIKKDKPLIGINVSQLMNHKTGGKYLTLMNELVDHILNRNDCSIVLVPHEIYPKDEKMVKDVGPYDTSKIGGDDIKAVKELYAQLKNKDRVIPITHVYTASELKGIISQCGMFIGARMHSNIAAVSTCVPTIVIAYSHKANGIMRMLDMEKYVYDFEEMDTNKFLSKVDNLWDNRIEIREILRQKTSALESSIWYNGEIVKNLLQTEKVV